MGGKERRVEGEGSKREEEVAEVGQDTGYSQLQRLLLDLFIYTVILT